MSTSQSSPPTMRALHVHNQQLVETTVAIPKQRPDELLIRVAYAGLNRADLFQVEGTYPPPEGIANIPGLEVSGTVVATGSTVSGWHIGDTICALLPGGGYGDYVTARADHCLPIPENLDLRHAAALPEAAATVWMALLDLATTRPGEHILVHGGSSGVGHLAIQMMRAHGAQVWATAGSDDKCAFCTSLGAMAINYRTDDFVAIAKQAGGMDVVLDIVGGDYINRNLKALRRGGRLISLSFLQGANVQLNAAGLLLKQLSWHGTTLRARSDAEKAAYIRQIHQTVWPWIESGRIAAHIDSVFPLTQAATAHEKMRKSLHLGKILLQLADS